MTGKTTKEKTRIIAIHAKRTVLEKMNIDEDGNLVDENTKLFSKDVMNKKKKMDPTKKNIKTNVAQHKKTLAMNISNQKSIMGIALKKLDPLNHKKPESSATSLRRSPRISPQKHSPDKDVPCADYSPGTSKTKSADISSPWSPDDLDESESEMPDGDGLITGPEEEERGSSIVIILDEVTEKDIQFQRKLLTALENAHKMKTGRTVKPEKLVKLEILSHF